MTPSQEAVEYDKNNVWHVEPINDLKPHTTTGIECRCNPKIEIQENGGVVVVHNSYDGRELLEKDNNFLKE